MHSQIFQISSHQIHEDDYLTSYDSISDDDFSRIRADYIGSPLSDDDLFDCLADVIPPEIASINRQDRTLKVTSIHSDFDKYIANYHSKITNELEQLKSKNSLYTFKLEETLIRNNINSVFHIDGYCHFHPDFIDTLRSYYLGQTLNIGSALDYHY